MVKTYFAIDFGTKRVGTAVAWSGLADPLTVLANDSHLYDNLLLLIQEHHPDVVVVGLSEQEMAKQTEAFVKAFKDFLVGKLETAPEFIFADETLSSVEVYKKLHQSGKRDIRQNGPIDHYAAAQILQEYLDLHQIA
jgi:putative transcription antitermination factor YqgF